MVGLKLTHIRLPGLLAFNLNSRDGGIKTWSATIIWKKDRYLNSRDGGIKTMTDLMLAIIYSGFKFQRWWD